MSCENNRTANCSCTYNCVRRGKCCECIAYHKRFGEFPACLFTREGESTYDRSLEQLIKDRKKQ